MAERAVALEDRINKVKLFVVQSTKQLNDKIKSEVMGMGWNNKPSVLVKPLYDKPVGLDKVMKAFEFFHDKVLDRISQVTADMDEQAIWFPNLKF
jgi:hypothetical protein